MESRLPPPVWVRAVISAWAFLILAADLKITVHPVIHWLVTGAAVTCALPYLLRLRVHWRRVLPGLTPACLLVLAVLLAGLGSDAPLYAIAEAGKLAIILIAARALFIAEPALAHAAMRGFIWAIAVNLLFLFLGLSGLAATASEMGPRRFGTLLNFPGSLARLGFLALCYAAYMVLAWRQPLRHLALLGACAALIYYDGSRTAWLLLAVLVPFVLFIRFTERRGRPSRLGRLAAVGVSLGAVLVVIAGWRWVQRQTEVPSGSGAIARIGQLAVNVRVYGAAGLAIADERRARMLEIGMDAFRRAPFIGTGVGTTQADTDIGLMVVHMTYLQIIGDLGLLGLFAYLWLVLGWLPFLPRAWRSISRLPNPESRAPYYNAIFLLGAFALSGLFHPLSTEWTEWIMFVVPSALFWEMSASYNAETSATILSSP